MNKDLHKIVTAHKVLIIPSDPDGDSIGTALGLADWLKQNGVQDVQIQCFMRASSYMQDNFDLSTISFIELADLDLQSFNYVILLDANALSQLFGEGWPSVKEKLQAAKDIIVLFDHHSNSADSSTESSNNATEYANCVVSDSEAACTAQIVYQNFIAPLTQQGLKPLSADAAYLFYIALLSDTGGLRWAVTASSLRFAADLVDLGVVPAKANEQKIPVAELEYMSWAIARTKFISDSKLVLFSLTSKLIDQGVQELGATFLDNSTTYKNFVLKNTAGFDYGVILVEKDPNTTKINWRTRDYGAKLNLLEQFTVAGFNVGGHPNAGGGTIDLPISQAEQAVINAITN